MTAGRYGPLVAVLAIASLAVLSAAAPVPKETAAERLRRLFGTPTDPAGDCRFALDDRDGLIVRVPGVSHRLVPNEVRSTAPRALRPVTGDFVATVTVRPVRVADDDDPGGVTFSAGLCVIGAGGEYLYHSRRTDLAGGRREATGGYGVWAANTLRALDTSGDEAYQADTTVLRIARRGGKFHLTASGDGDRWADVGTVEAGFPTRLAVGVFAAQGGPVPFAAGFESFALTTGP